MEKSMENKLKGCFAGSLAGHDKCRIYVIIDEDEEYVYLSDGVIRTVDKPKKKKRKHIQPVKRIDDNIAEKLEKHKNLNNEDIKRAIKLYISKMKEDNTCQSQM